MNVAAMNNLWHYISGLSLTAKNKQWLSQKLLESTRREKASSKADEALRKLCVAVVTQHLRHSLL